MKKVLSIVLVVFILGVCGTTESYARKKTTHRKATTTVNLDAAKAEQCVSAFFEEYLIPDADMKSVCKLYMTNSFYQKWYKAMYPSRQGDPMDIVTGLGSQGAASFIGCEYKGGNKVGITISVEWDWGEEEAQEGVVTISVVGDEYRISNIQYN